MKTIVTIILIINSCFAYSQKKGDNTIIVKGVSFKEVVNRLMDDGFQLEKIDSNYRTARSEFKEGTGKNKWMKYRISVREKDSAIILKGDWYNTMFIGNKVLGQEQTVENNIANVEFTSGNPKNCFLEIDRFAKSFSKPIEYLKQ